MPILRYFVVVLILISSSVTEAHFLEANYIYRPKIDVGYYYTSSLIGSHKIALTFDDGPQVRTMKLLNVLKKYNVKATFFLLASSINPTNTPIVKRMLADGHIIADHGYTHANINDQTEPVFKEAMTRSLTMLRDLIAQNGNRQIENYYRIPGGAYGLRPEYHHFNTLKDVSQNLFNGNCINPVFWDIAGIDWIPEMTPQNIKDTVMANIFGGTSYTYEVQNGRNVVKPQEIKDPIGGGVVLLHETHPNSAEAAELIITEARARGVEIVPLNTIEEYNYTGSNCVY